MKPYDKKIINKKITQALIGVTTLGTILAMPISIDMQDNSMSIIRDNKVLAAEDFKGVTGNVKWINGNFSNNILGLPFPSTTDLDTKDDNDVNSAHNSLWHWSKMFSWVQERYHGWTYGGSSHAVFRGGKNAAHIQDYKLNEDGSGIFYPNGWRPVLEVNSNDPLIADRKTGDIVKFGTAYVNDEKINRPNNASKNKNTDLLSYTDPVHKNAKIKIANTDIDDNYKIQWVYINDGNKNLLIADRDLMRVSWEVLNMQGLVDGKTFTIEGKDYKCRILTGGETNDDWNNNEWDKYISMEYWKKFVDKFYNIQDIKKYGSWSNMYYGKSTYGGKYGEFNAKSEKSTLFSHIISKDEIAQQYLFANGRMVTIDNYGMVNDCKTFTDTQPATVPIDGTKIKNMFLGNIEDIGLVPMMEKNDGYIWYIDNDNKERMLPIEKSEFKDTLIYHKKYNKSDKFLFVKNDGKLTYFDKDRFEKETAINMNDVEKIIPSTNVTDDLFLMKDGSIKNLDGSAVDFEGKKLKEILSNRFLVMDDNFIYTLQGMSIKNTDTLEMLHNKSVNNLLWLKNGKVMIADDNGDLSFLNDINGKLIKTLVKIDETGTFILMKDNTTKAYGSVKNCGDLLSKGIDYNDIISIVSDNGKNNDKKFIVMKNGTLYNFDGQLTGVQLTDAAIHDIRDESDFTFDDTEPKDKEAPEINLIGIPEDWTNKYFTITVKATDNTKVKSIKLPDGTFINGDTGTFTIKENGTYSFVAEDEAGNTKTKELKVSNIDKVAPTKPSITRIEDSIKITEGKDNESGIKQTLYKINNGNWIDLKDFNLNNLINGENTIYAKSIDKAGNESDVSEFKVTIKDKETPIIKVLTDLSEWTKENQTINIKATHNKRISKVTIDNDVININNWSEIAAGSYPKNGFYDYVYYEITGENNKEINIKLSKAVNGTYKIIVEDEVGNKTSKEIIVNKIDQELPVINSINVAGNKLTITATDNLSGIKEILYKIDDGEFIRYAGEVTLSPGAHKIKVKAIDNAGNTNDQNDSSSEIHVNVEDEGKKTLEGATKAVEDEGKKTLEGATKAVEKAENSQSQDDVDKARDKVNKLPDGKVKDDLNNRLDEVQDNINKKKDQEQKLKEEKAAKDAVEKAEKTKKDEDIKDAENKVSKLPDGKVKDDLNNRLDDIKKQIKAEKDAYIKAYNAVKKAKSTLDKSDYEYAKKAVQELNTTIYKNEKAQLQRILDALKPYIDRKENQSKQEERNQIRNIESLIRKAIVTKDSKTIEEAQGAIDKLGNLSIKIELQKRLDTTNRVSQMDLAIQARDAVEKLDRYINYADIINNLDELKDLYKDAEKAINRLDNNSQYKNRMDKAKGYMEVMETLAKYKENAEKNNILASEKEMTELISKANQLSFTTRNKQNIIKEILQFQEELKDLSETIPSPEA
ncbi:hypothetical protein EXM63_06455 [Clostridium botulinum]|uniref:Bacterial Ig-like domain family protein n=1 Tax=Clostridium botulinum TaxID=1491 RepID=A0A6M0T2B5_CLOBO|nr:hypothetical protein [Clostridium botulinum]NFI74258.1 hypothetical protein [Clostridium sporogenes]NFP62166.1 hypothetical protein [Clostridium sporogenes]NFU95682.1 hypothetical protein [Clostridium sporogenes]NFV68668.1 hypothetical protein [Clostridium botulinum]